MLGASGPLNIMLRGVGLGALAVPWLGTTETSSWRSSASALWSFFGLGVITHLAGLASLNDEVLEAGASTGRGSADAPLHRAADARRRSWSYWAVLCLGGMFIWMFPFVFS